MAAAICSKVKSEELMQNIKVVVRVRPLNNDEKENKVRSIVFCESQNDIQFKERKYTFDRVFKPNSSQIDIYMYVVGPMIADVLAGYNCTVFAYGPTGTGKTHTMTGTNSNMANIQWKDDISSGCIPRAAAHIFEELKSMKVYDFNVRISFLELYNEEVRDLLSDEDKQCSLNIYNDSKKSVYIQGLNEISVFNGNDVNMLLEKGTNRRQTASTRINNRSSRSHAVFTITVHTKELNFNGEEILKTGKINLVDLAGSENIAKSGAKDKRAQESVNINKSLLTLGRVIHILAERTNKHIPYRDSKLTRILQDSLGGHSKTCIIATISSSHLSLEETQNTLEYASRARDIKNTPTMNEKVEKNEMLKDMLNEIEKLKKELEIVRSSGDGFFIDRSNWEELNKELEGAQNTILLKNELIGEMERRIESLNAICEAKKKDFDQIMDVCKKRTKAIQKSEDVLKKLRLSLKQEQYISNYYETASSEVSSEVSDLLAYTKTLLNYQDVLQDKLKDRYLTNCNNERIVNQTAEALDKELLVISNEINNLKHTTTMAIDKQLSSIQAAIELKLQTVQEFNEILNNDIYPNLDESFNEQKSNLEDTMSKIKDVSYESHKEASMVLNKTDAITECAKTVCKNFKGYNELALPQIDNLENLSTSTCSQLKECRQTKDNASSDLEKYINSTVLNVDSLDKIVNRFDNFAISNKREDLLPEKTAIEEAVEKIVSESEKTTIDLENIREYSNQFLKDILENETSVVSDFDRFKDSGLYALTKFSLNPFANGSNATFHNIEENCVKLKNSISCYTGELQNLIDDTEKLMKKEIIENIVPAQSCHDTPNGNNSNIYVPERISDVLPRDILLNKFRTELDEGFHNDFSFNLSLSGDSDVVENARDDHVDN